MNPTIYCTSHQLICKLLRGVLRDAMQAEPGTASGIGSVRWDNGIWEAQLDVSYVTAVSQEQEATVTPLSPLPRKRTVGQ